MINLKSFNCKLVQPEYDYIFFKKWPLWHNFFKCVFLMINLKSFEPNITADANITADILTFIKAVWKNLIKNSSSVS